MPLESERKMASGYETLAQLQSESFFENGRLSTSQRTSPAGMKRLLPFLSCAGMWSNRSERKLCNTSGEPNGAQFTHSLLMGGQELAAGVLSVAVGRTACWIPHLTGMLRIPGIETAREEGGAVNLCGAVNQSCVSSIDPFS